MSTEEVRRKALADLAETEEGEPCMAVHAIAVLDVLGFDDEQVRAVEDAGGILSALKRVSGPNG